MSTATELLRRALDALHFDLSAKESAKVAEDIRTFLAAEEERKPKFIRKKVCWNCGWPIKETRPEPARKPMTEVEMMTGYGKLKPHGLVDFALGVRFAEKNHGISSSIPSLNDTISADSRDLRL